MHCLKFDISKKSGDGFHRAPSPDPSTFYLAHCSWFGLRARDSGFVPSKGILCLCSLKNSKKGLNFSFPVWLYTPLWHPKFQVSANTFVPKWWNPVHINYICNLFPIFIIIVSIYYTSEVDRSSPNRRKIHWKKIFALMCEIIDRLRWCPDFFPSAVGNPGGTPCM